MPRNRAAYTRAGVAALIFGVIVELEHTIFAGQAQLRWVLIATAGLAGVAIIRALVDGIFGTVRDQRILLWRNLTSWSLYIVVALFIASETNINISGLLLGGAILGVVAASASQAPLGNFFAGLILLIARPFSIGDTIRVRSSLSGAVEYEGTVVDARAFYTTLVTADGQLLRMPNSAVIASVIVVGGAPLQAELAVELAEAAGVGAVKEHLRQRLPDDSVLEVRPRSLDAPGRRLTCDVRVRSRRPIPDGDLADALFDALHSAEAA